MFPLVYPKCPPIVHEISPIFEEASQSKEAFWAKQASCLEWFAPWNSVLEWDPPLVKWFLGGKLNACYNCLDRHMNTATSQKIALL